MKLNKWNYKTHSYDLVNVPDEWKCSTYEYDINKIINCPHCGDEFKVGKGYTSLEFHTKIGFGFIVCETCYEKELKRKYKNKEVKDDFNNKS